MPILFSQIDAFQHADGVEYASAYAEVLSRRLFHITDIWLDKIPADDDYSEVPTMTTTEPTITLTLTRAEAHALDRALVEYMPILSSQIDAFQHANGLKHASAYAEVLNRRLSHIIDIWLDKIPADDDFESEDDDE